MIYLQSEELTICSLLLAARSELAADGVMAGDDWPPPTHAGCLVPSSQSGQEG